MTNRKICKCRECGRKAEEILEYKFNPEGMPAEDYAKEDGTYNADNNTFICTKCYIKIGMPTI